MSAPDTTGDNLTEAHGAEQNKVWGILAYITFLIPLLAAPKQSKFARYHTNQGLVLVITAVALSVVLGIISAVATGAMIAAASAGGFLAITGIISLAWTVIGIGIAVLAIIGIVRAATGVCKPLPLIGRFTLLK
jgi:uncharacterized membrane protein